MTKLSDSAKLLGSKGGRATAKVIPPGSEAAKIRSEKANAAKKAKSDERRALNELQKAVDELKNPKLLAGVKKRLSEAKREGKK